MKNMHSLGAALVLVCACSGGNGSSTTPTRTAQDVAGASRGQAFGLVMKTTSCWMGGLWADALGEKYDDRTAGIEQRCGLVLQALDTTAEETYKPLRAIEPKVVERISAKVADLAHADAADAPHGAELTALFGHIAEASRETLHARHAADQVKEDAAKNPAPPTYAADKNAAAPALGESTAMRAMFADRGAYASEAHTIGLLLALDRMEIAHGLSKHLKVDAVRDAYAVVFGVAAPTVTGEAAERTPPGVWLGYLTDVAKAAQHPVPSSVTALPDRETLGWTGVLEGFADKLRAEPAYGASETPLGAVVRGVVARLDDEYQTARKLMQARGVLHD